MPTIIDIRAREVFDSRADITLEVEVVLDRVESQDVV